MSRLAIDVGGTWLRYELIGEDMYLVSVQAQNSHF